MRPLLVLRPEPGASATVVAARAMGLEAIPAPLFVLRPVAWTLPESLPQAVLLTSASAIRHGGPQLAALHGRPVYAVGAATAAAARAHGFGEVVAGDGGVDAVLALAARDGRSALLHLAGREWREPAAAPVRLVRRTVYAADAVAALPEAAVLALPVAVALLHSPRAARLFAALVDPSAIAIAAISEAAREAAGQGWRTVAVADRPTDASLLAVAAKLCHHHG